jgi:hypothetical protein
MTSRAAFTTPSSAETSLEIIRRHCSLAQKQFHADNVATTRAGRKQAAELAPQFAAIALCLADCASIAQHIDPDTTDVDSLFRLMEQSLTALAAELAQTKEISS